MAAFGELLRRLREQAGLSQRGLAQAVGWNPAVVNRLEHGDRPPSGPRQVIVLADALRLDQTQRDALLVSAGLWPEAFAALGPRDGTLVGVARVLASDAVDEASKQRFRRAVDALVEQWLLAAGATTS